MSFFSKSYKLQKMGPVPINDMQIPPQPPTPPSKVAKLGFWSKKMRNNFYFLRYGRFCTQNPRKFRK